MTTFLLVLIMLSKNFQYMIDFLFVCELLIVVGFLHMLYFCSKLQDAV